MSSASAAARPLVGFCGPKFSGKDACGNILSRSFQFQHGSFAGFLKEACRSIFMLSYAQLYGEEKEVVDPRWQVTPRELLQKVGTDLFRERLSEVLPDLNLGEDRSLWCRCMRLWLEDQPPTQRIVITDVRFPDEAALIRSLGGVVVRVVRPDTNRLAPPDPHPSEQEQLKIEADFTIQNDGTLADLEVVTRRWVRQNLLSSPLARPPTQGLRFATMPQTVEDLSRGEPVIVGPRREPVMFEPAILGKRVREEKGDPRESEGSQGR